MISSFLPVGEGHVTGRHPPVDQAVERMRVPGDGSLGLLCRLLVDRDIVVDALVVVVHRNRQSALRRVLA